MYLIITTILFLRLNFSYQEFVSRIRRYYANLEIFNTSTDRYNKKLSRTVIKTHFRQIGVNTQLVPKESTDKIFLDCMRLV